MDPRTRRLIVPGVLALLVMVVVLGAVVSADAAPPAGVTVNGVSANGSTVAEATDDAQAVDTPRVAATQAYAAFGLAEASGLTSSALHPGVVWVVEDDGDSAMVLAFDPSGAQVGSLTFEASDVFAGDNRDTESLVMGPGPTLWSADIGDNNAVRETVLVHTTPEPATLGDAAVTAVSYRFRYLDGPRDAEALLVDPVGGRAYIASKGVLGGGGWYAAPAQLVPGETHDLTLVQDLPGLITGGEFSPDGSVVALRTLGLRATSVATLYDVVRGAADAPITLEARGEVTLPAQEQGESLTFSQDGTALLVGSEGESEPIWSVPLPNNLAPTSTDDGSAPIPGSTPAAADSPQVPTASTTSDDRDDRRRCRRRIPGDCLSTPTGLLVLVGGGVVALGVGLVIAIRRRR